MSKRIINLEDRYHIVSVESNDMGEVKRTYKLEKYGLLYLTKHTDEALGLLDIETGNLTILNDKVLGTNEDPIKDTVCEEESTNTDNNIDEEEESISEPQVIEPKENMDILYTVTDNTGENVEKAYLLSNSEDKCHKPNIISRIKKFLKNIFKK